jgi:hypothetical protein
MTSKTVGRSREEWERLAGSLGLAGAMAGDARTPGAVDAFWWLTLPPMQACLELGIGADEYPKVHQDISQMAALVENRRAQGKDVDIPFTIPRRKTAHLREMTRGGSVRRIRRIGSPER